jgi:5-deoxy-glucuronate isomerase
MKRQSHPNLILKCDRSKGLKRVIELGNKALPNIGFSLLNAVENETFHLSSNDKELCLVILSGKWRFYVKGMEFVGERVSVFKEKPYAVYLPLQTEFQLKAEKEGEIAFCESRGVRKGEVLLIPPSQVKERFLGDDNFQRFAFDILDERVEADSLLVGETISKPGHWSSFPPHKHDRDDFPRETALEELYFFMFNPQDGFGFQRIYTEDRSLDESFLIENRSVVFIPSGYHPVVSSPGYSLYYLWILAGKKRILKSYFDPAYRWINDRMISKREE